MGRLDDDLNRFARVVRGREGASGATPPPTVQAEKERVVQVTPVLMSQPLTGGAPAPVQYTDAVKGVAVDDIIYVVHQGISKRFATGLVYPKSLADKHGGETAVTIGGSDVAVGGSLSVRAKVGSGSYANAYTSGSGQISIDLPAPASGASSTHTHTLPNVTLPTRTAAAVNESVTHGGFDQPLRVVVNDMQADFDALRNSLQANLTTNDQTSGPVG